MREPEITVNGTVTGVLRGAYEVELANGLMVRPMLSGRMMRHKIRVSPSGGMSALEAKRKGPTGKPR